MVILYAMLVGFVLDLLFGDPAWLPHPVVWMGKYIAWFERTFRPRFPQAKKGEFWGGVLLTFSLTFLTLLVTTSVCLIARQIHPAAEWAIQSFWCAQALAAKGLATESKAVYTALQEGNLSDARQAVARIVGRDTQRLDAEGVAKAAIETVAENTSDGVIAPMFYMAIGGTPFALCYKAINTMDSMVGYKNETYLFFGRAAARLDDAVNYLPSRMAALCWITVSGWLGYDGKAAFRLWKRDARKHTSPNSGQTESACAGALGIQVGGDAWYFGQYHKKATLGDALRPCEARHILDTNRMMYATSVLFFFLCAAGRYLLMRLC